MAISPFDYRPRTRIVFGAGEFARLGELAREFDAKRCLLVADQSMVDSKIANEAIRSLRARRMDVYAFHDFGSAPTPETVEAGRAYAAQFDVHLIVGLGRGGALDMAKAINVVLTSGGSIQDYYGYGKPQKTPLPMIAAPATAGAGSEAQSQTIIYDPQEHTHRSCGDPRLAFRMAILDPKLTLSQPPDVTAASGFDAISHSIETLTSTRRSAISECFSREAWRLLNENYERVLSVPEDINARGAMLLGAHYAGMAVESSTLGPAHACAVPLSSHYKLLHGAAVGLTLPDILDWSETSVPYDLSIPRLSGRLRDLRSIANLPASLRDAAVPEEALPRLAEEAAAQWTAKFSPKPFDVNTALEIYRAAF
jgi:alcohol dehydrogenase